MASKQSNSSICISGPHLEETTIMLRKVLAMWPIRVAFVKVSEVFWSRNQFFERILVQLRMSVATVTRHASYQNYQEGHAYLPAQRKGYRNSEKCGSSATFLETLKHIFLPTNSASQGFEKAYILLEGIEKLDVKVFGNKIIPVLLRIQELVRAQFFWPFGNRVALYFRSTAHSQLFFVLHCRRHPFQLV